MAAPHANFTPQAIVSHRNSLTSNQRILLQLPLSESVFLLRRTFFSALVVSLFPFHDLRSSPQMIPSRSDFFCGGATQEDWAKPSQKESLATRHAKLQQELEAIRNRSGALETAMSAASLVDRFGSCLPFANVSVCSHQAA